MIEIWTKGGNINRMASPSKNATMAQEKLCPAGGEGGGVTTRPERGG